MDEIDRLLVPRLSHDPDCPLFVACEPSGGPRTVDRRGVDHEAIDLVDFFRFGCLQGERLASFQVHLP